MQWKTKVTELLGCQYPILEGAFSGFGNWQFAASIANAGAHGLITAQNLHGPEQLEESIKKCRAATNGTFGVNINIGLCKQEDQMLEVCIRNNVPVETAGYKPDALVPRIKESGIVWIHKAARIKDCLHAASLGCDAVIIVGLEGAGFKSPEQLPTLIATTWGVPQFKVPFIASGGIGDARGFLGALGMGAEGIMMGTAFMATKECPIDNAAKEALIKASPDNLQLRYQVLASADPQKYAEILKLRGTMPVGEWLHMLERIQPDHADSNTDRTSKEYRQRPRSLSVGVIGNLLTVQELVDGIVQGAEAVLDSWQFLKTR
jgi:NAD(P)H-dependent flavin oxidoreductase YrpB (nitropropane dioxygenase family)